jgi:hypothetical protein
MKPRTIKIEQSAKNGNGRVLEGEKEKLVVSA